jgi:hypothetical protein
MDSKLLGSIDKEDLYLLMEAYRNTFESNTTLLEHQKTLIENIKILIEGKKITNIHLEEFNKALKELQTELILQNLDIKGRINIIWIGIGAIIVPIIGLIIEIFSKFNTISTLLNSVHIGGG